MLFIIPICILQIICITTKWKFAQCFYFIFYCFSLAPFFVSYSWLRQCSLMNTTTSIKFNKYYCWLCWRRVYFKKISWKWPYWSFFEQENKNEYPNSNICLTATYSKIYRINSKGATEDACLEMSFFVLCMCKDRIKDWKNLKFWE